MQCLPRLSFNQHGFLPHRSCEEAIEALIEFIDKNAQPTYAVFVDFRMAFDNVRREKLIQAVSERFDIGGKLMRILISILEPNKLVVDTGYARSRPIDQEKGIIQGGSVSPLLFVMFVNSLLERLERRKVLAKMFADDLVIAGEDADEVQRSLAALSIWCEENGILVNVETATIVKFRKAGAQGEMKLFIDRKQIEFVQHFKYLGIIMQPALRFNDRIEHRSTGTAAAIACLGNLRKLPIDLALKLIQDLRTEDNTHS